MCASLNFLDICDDKYHYTFGYYAENKWLDAQNLVFLRGNTPEIATDISSGATAELVIYNIETGEYRLIAEGISYFTDFLAHGKTVYYVKEGTLIAHESDTGKERILFKERGIGSPHITNDGRYISLFSCSRESCRFFRVDVELGIGELMFDKIFAEPFPFANHGMIAPCDKDIIFFAHEGNTECISDRLWLYNAKLGKAYNIAKQNKDSSGAPLDCFGHECWAHDGSGLYFVKYRESKSGSGICYADIWGSEPKVIYNGYDYWHVGASPSGNYLLADTRNLGDNRSGVVLINKKSGEEKLIDTPRTSFRHPCHPHPALSVCDKKLIYHFLSENNTIGIRVVSLE